MHSIDLCRQFFQRIIGLRDKAISFDLSVEDVSTDLLARLYA
jgi:ABC-type phosphate/phosphonate transport system ATPase subunit